MFEAMKRRLLEFFYQEDGPTATEYAVMFAMILVVCIASVRVLGTKVNAGFASASVGW